MLLDRSIDYSIIEDLKIRASSCTMCSLHINRKVPVFSKGAPTSNIVLCGMCPGPDENKESNVDKAPFVGPAGKFLDEILKDVDLTIGDVYITNIVKCFVKPGIKLSTEWTKACIEYFVYEVSLLVPAVIVTLGKDAFEGLLGPADLSLGEIRKKGPYRFLDTQVIPSYHPSYFIRAGRKEHKDYDKIIEDLNKAKLLSKGE